MSAAGIAAAGLDWLVAASLQAGALALAVLLADLALRRFAWPRLRVALHSLVLIKLLVPPGLGGGLALATVPERLERIERLAGVATGGLTSAGGDSSGAFALAAFGLWGIVAALLLAGSALMDRRARRQIAGSATAASSRALALTRALASDLQLRRVPRLVESDRVEAPLVFGGAGGWIVVPRGATTSLMNDELEHVLLHELTHLRRRDPLGAGLCAAVARLFWFHPLVWLVERRLTGLRELACDAAVAAHFRGDPRRLRSYRRTLLRAAARRFDLPLPERPLPAGALGWSSGASLLSRLDWLGRPRRARPRLERRLTALVVALLAVVVLPTARAEVGRTGAGGTEAADPLLERARATVAAALHGQRPPGCLQLHYSVLVLAADASSPAAERR